MKHLLLAITLIVGLQSIAQKKEKPTKKEDAKYFYKDASIETSDYNIYIVDVVANVKQAKFKIRIFNKTNDYLLVKPTEFAYIAGNKKILSSDKTYAIAPNEEEAEVIDFKATDMLSETFTVDFKGIYKASAGGKPYTVADFDLPSAKNEFTVEDFTCILKKADLEKDKSVVKFDCIYNGDGVAIINPVKASAIMPNGQENTNAKKHKPLILEKGKKDDFFVVYTEIKGAGDMKKQGFKIKWNDTFRASKLLPIGNVKLELVKDLEKK